MAIEKDEMKQEGLSATELLRADHAKVKGLFDEFEAIEEDEGGKQGLVTNVLRELIIHDKLEEEIFYPACREALEDSDILDEAAEEHHVMKLLIAELARMEPRDDKYDAKFRVMADAVRRHIEKEEGEIIPALEESDSDLMEFGTLMQRRKEELYEQGIEPAVWAREGAGPGRRRQGERRATTRSRVSKGRRVSGGRRASRKPVSSKR